MAEYLQTPVYCYLPSETRLKQVCGQIGDLWFVSCLCREQTERPIPKFPNSHKSPVHRRWAVSVKAGGLGAGWCGGFALGGMPGEGCGGMREWEGGQEAGMSDDEAVLPGRRRAADDDEEDDEGFDSAGEEDEIVINAGMTPWQS